MGNLDRHLEQMRHQGYGVNYGRYQTDHLTGPVPVRKEEPLAEDPPEAVYTCTCNFCGKIFAPENKFVRYCSDQCREGQRKKVYLETYHRQVPKELVICPVCGETFLPQRRGTKYCSKSCRRRMDYQRKLKGE